MISYTVTVSREIVETTSINVRAIGAQSAVEQALIVARENDTLDWQRSDLMDSPRAWTPYAGVYSVAETKL